MDHKFRKTTYRNSKKQIDLVPAELEMEAAERAEGATQPPAESTSPEAAPTGQVPTEVASTELAPTEPASTKPPKKDPFKKLKKAVGKKVVEQSDEIAKSLVEATIAGNSNSARIVVGLVDKRRRSESDTKKLKKAALSHKSGVQKAIELRQERELSVDEAEKLTGDSAELFQKPALTEKEDPK